MEIHLVTATDNTPLTKHFTKKPDGSYDKQSYPNVTFVNSTKIEIDGTPETFCSVLKQAAQLSAYLLTGKLAKELHNESRAGYKVENQLSDWVVFDIDGLDVDSIEQFVQDFLPKPFHDVTYIQQHSASAGIIDDGVRAHVFFMLEEPVDPSQIKLWTTETNLDTPALRSQLALGAGGGSLRFPLDRIANDHARVLYIAPPICTNFTDPLAGERITLVTKSRSHAVFPFHASGPEVIRRKERVAIQELRDKGGLSKKQMKVRTVGDFDVLLDADPITVTEWWESGGFIHMNIEGGDSGAYWISPKRPKYIKNFKGEAALVLREVAPAFWQEIKDLCTSDEMLLFRDKITDTYFAGKYDLVEDKILEIYPIAKSNISNWVNVTYDRDIDLKDIDQVDYEFDPTNKKVVDRDNGKVNMFNPTEYMRLPVTEGETYEIPPTIHKLLLHLCGDDQDVAEWVLNREAVIFQRRIKTGTALVMQGAPGVGKGLYNKKVIRPLYGQYSQVIQLSQQQEDLFNSFLKDSLIVHVEEAQANEKMRDKLFHWIADEAISVRRMRQEAKQVETYCNFTFTSNHLNAQAIEEDDRRFTVTPRQETKLMEIMTDEEIDEFIPKELSAFARYLLTRVADVAKARVPLENDAKKQMRLDNMSTADLYVHAVKDGDLDWLIDCFIEGGDTKLGVEGVAVRRMIEQWIPYVNKQPCPVFKRDLRVFYTFITGHTDTTDVGFGNMMRNRGFSIKAGKKILIDKERLSGVHILWKASPESLQLLEKALGGLPKRTVGDVIGIKEVK